ncbi:MAG: twin-arginine translocation signal domain-containing protein, partial [Nevskiales bacterium]
MPINRRDFLLQGGLATAALAVSPPAFEAEPLPQLPLCGGAALRKVAFRAQALPSGPPLNPLTLARFVDSLPIPPVLRS